MPIKKKRGRKKKVVPVSDVPVVKKKRGRKPKGGKLININSIVKEQKEEVKSSIILHLKCSSKELENPFSLDINYDPTINNIESYDLTSHKYSSLEFDNINNQDNEKLQNTVLFSPTNNMTNKTSTKETIATTTSSCNCEVNRKIIWDKLSKLKVNLHHNNIRDKKSNCFWCTCPFNNQAIYIPKSQHNDIFDVYGCFCSPECSVAYLNNENIDNSTRWERYMLLNNVYGKIYNYKKNIKPAPSPFYTLDKYFGSLTIEEYRKLHTQDNLLFVVDKPLTKILPELHEEMNENPNIFKRNKVNKKNIRLKSNIKRPDKNTSLSAFYNKN